MRVESYSDEAFDPSEVRLFRLPVYSKVNVRANKLKSLYVYGADDVGLNEITDVVESLCNDEHSGEDGYMANFSKLGVEVQVSKPEEYEYELPPQYSPTDVYFVKVKLLRYDDDVQGIHGQRIVTYPYLGPDYQNAIYFSAGHMLVPCNDAFYRYCNDYEIMSVERYKV